MKKDKIIPSLNKRIVDFAKHKGLRAFDFSSKLQYKSSSQFSRVANGGDVEEFFILRMLEAFPLLNKEWLLEGKGDMETYPTMASEPESPIYRVTKKDLPLIPHDPMGKSIPFYDTDVYATIIPSMSDVVAMKPSAFINIPMFSQGEYAVPVTGHSMKGYINHGDWVVIKKITNHESIMYGEAHLIVTKSDNLKTVKFLKPSKNPEKLTLVPYNIEQFEPHEIRKDDVIEIYRVIGSFRSH
jgi:SOS-response transcriptional repressor LexA